MKSITEWRRASIVSWTQWIGLRNASAEEMRKPGKNWNVKKLSATKGKPTESLKKRNSKNYAFSFNNFHYSVVGHDDH